MRYIYLIILILYSEILFAQETVVNKYKNGNKQSEGQMVNGSEEGLWTYYDQNGKMTEQSNYIKGFVLR